MPHVIRHLGNANQNRETPAGTHGDGRTLEHSGGRPGCPHCLWGCKMGPPHWKTVRRSYQLNTLPSHEAALGLLGICPKELNCYVHANTCTWNGRVIIAETGKQPRCPSVTEWTNRLWSFRTMECSSARNGNELSIHEDTEGTCTRWGKPVGKGCVRGSPTCGLRGKAPL